MNPIIERMKENEKFKRFLVAVDEKEDFRDATYFLRDDGSFIFSEGYCHGIEKPRGERKIVSHIVFAPWNAARPAPEYAQKMLFGQKYENVTKEIMTTQPLDRFYPMQLKRYIDVDPAQAEHPRPIYARYKAMIPLASIVGCFPHRHSLQAIIAKADEDPSARSVKIVTEHTAELLRIGAEQIGISGSLSLGTYKNPHDLDYVIYGTASQVKRMVNFMYSLTDTDEKRRVHEFGKYWPIRFWDWAGKEKFMVCPFFSYIDPEEAPLRNFDCENLGEATVEGRIADHTHNAFNPSVLILEEAKLNGKEHPPITRFILYHGGERGDWREGYRVSVKGYHVRIVSYRVRNGQRQKKEEFEAVLVNNLDQAKRINK